MKNKQMVTTPFPKLVRNDFGGKGSGLFSWKGVVRLESWRGFAGHQELSSDRWTPTRGRLPDGNFPLTVDPVNRSKDARPTPEQAKAFEVLTRKQAELRDAILASLFEVYPKWRETYFGCQISSDGGKTYQRGWDLPDLFPRENMPEIQSRDELLRLVRPAGIYVLNEASDGIARIRVGFSCKWDEEHGFAVLIHRGEDIEVGDSDLGI